MTRQKIRTATRRILESGAWCSCCDDTYPLKKGAVDDAEKILATFVSVVQAEERKACFHGKYGVEKAERARCLEHVRTLYEHWPKGSHLSRQIVRLMKRIANGKAPGGRP